MYSIGIDIGGTSIKGGQVDYEGKVLDTFVVPVNKGEGQLVTCARLIEELVKFVDKVGKENISGIGIGCAGAINSTTGVVDYSNNLDWHNLPLVKMIEDRLGLKAKITNDANAAALGEAKFGAGKEYKTAILLTLGTGVGGGIIINDEIYDGNEGKGAELGHMKIELHGRECTCGRFGCLEAYASASALIKDTKEAMMKDKSSKLWELVNGDIAKVNGKVAFDAEALGDKTAKEVVDNYVMYLSEGILNFCNIFRPDVIILSGGIANQRDNLNNRLTAYCDERDYGFHCTPKVLIKTATLGYNSGIIGAACLFIK